MVENRIREYREKAHMSQNALAQKSGVAQSTISEIEAGKHEPAIGVALQLAGALRVTVDTLFVLEKQKAIDLSIIDS